MTKRFTIIDPKTNDTYAGLTDLPIDHAQMLLLVPDKAFQQLDLHEKTYAHAGRDVLLVVRER